MFLSDRDLELAINSGLLIVNPKPRKLDTTGFDLHLDSIKEAAVWDVPKWEKTCEDDGKDSHLRIGKFKYKEFSPKYTRPLTTNSDEPVYREGDTVIVKRHGFFLWQTKEVVGTPEDEARFICFVEGKSSRARTGFLVHMTAPTIHANWFGNITLEICNLGPFTVALREGDSVAQLTVATITSPPTKRKASEHVAPGQKNIQGGGR